MSEVRRSVDPAERFDGSVFHYLIPNIQATGDGQLEPASEIGSAKLQITGPTLLVSKLNPRKGVVLEARVRHDAPTVCSSEFVCLLPKKCHLRFASYLFQSEQVRQHLDGLVKSATRSHQRIQPSDITKLWLRWPPLPTQRAIAAFLDRETAKIDALLEKKRRLLDLLHEKRTALITHAVTRGLDPDVPMRDSGVEWLGEIPAHWDVRQLMYLTQPPRPIMYGIVLPGPHAPNGIPLVKGGNVKPGRLRLDQLNRVAREIEADHARSRLMAGDLVYAIRGSIGEVEVVPEELDGANLTQDAARISVQPRICRTWLLYALRSRPVFAQLDAGTLGATIRGVNIRDLKRVRLPVPPPNEQRQIADEIEAEMSKTHSLADHSAKAISLLQEYRTALISAAVTGQIDVSEAAA